MAVEIVDAIKKVRKKIESLQNEPEQVKFLQKLITERH
jgi:hypothetical protein